MHTNRLKTKEKRENHEFKIWRSGCFLTGERGGAVEGGCAEGFKGAGWVTVWVNFIIHFFFSF